MLGAVFGALATALTFVSLVPWEARRDATSNRGHLLLKPSATKERFKDWLPDGVDSKSGWCFVRYDEAGWSTGAVGTFDDLRRRLENPAPIDVELVIPVFETVFAPDITDKLYYDAILQSEIAPGDKVLVVGPGSGADTWAAALKSGGPVHVVDVNPMAVANTLVSARLGNFEVRPFVGDIGTAELPEDFNDFDFVLWNMPFIKAGATAADFERRNFHDGDDGSLLRAFLARLPQLLVEDGLAILLNSRLAEEWTDLRSDEKGAANKSEAPVSSATLFFVRGRQLYDK